MDVKECIQEYRDLSSKVFGKKRTSIPIDMCGNARAKYNSEELEEFITNLVKKKTGVAHKPFKHNGNDDKCKV